jgi:hypothetical protein
MVVDAANVEPLAEVAALAILILINELKLNKMFFGFMHIHRPLF